MKFSCPPAGIVHEAAILGHPAGVEAVIHGLEAVNLGVRGSLECLTTAREVW